MAFKALFQEEVTESSGQLPLVRKWVKAQVKEGNNPYEIPLEIRSMKVSGSGDWVIIETDQCSGLVNTKSQLGRQLEQLIPTLKGEGKMLVLLPQKSGKLGFSIGVDDEQKVHYKYNEEEEYLWINRDKVPQVETVSSLTSENILSPVSPSASGTKAKGKSTDAAQSNGTASAAKSAILAT